MKNRYPIPYLWLSWNRLHVGFKTTFSCFRLLSSLSYQSLTTALVVLLCVLTIGSGFAQRRYVSVDGTNAIPSKATSWATATADLQGAIDALAKSGGEVWVKAGLYKPGGNATTSRTLSFSMVDEVKIYGGFAGTESLLSSRPGVNPNTGQPSSTTLSGDINTLGNPNDNSYHVIYNTGSLTNTAVLDGFVIVSGNASGTATNGYGGGIYNSKSSRPLISNCLFQSNFAYKGGAIANDASGSSNGVVLQLTNSRFVTNKALSDGGALFSGPATGPGSGNSITLKLNNVGFMGNTAANAGGAIHSDGSVGKNTLTLTNVGFSSNTATQGGALYNGLKSYLTLTNVSFGNNTATQGGAIVNQSGPLQLTNGVLYGNGGANTFYSAGGSTLQVGYSLVESTVTSYTSGLGNLTATVSPFASTTGLQLTASAPAINAGDPAVTASVVGSTDLDGNPRIVGCRIDMGAFESSNTTANSLTRLYVNASATGANKGIDWANAFTNLQAAFDYQATTCGSAVTEIWVAQGMYKPGGNGNTDRSISFPIKSGLSLYGGFLGTETSLSQRPEITYFKPSSTTLTGDIGTVGNVDDNSYHVLSSTTPMSSSAIIDGFVITAGNANSTGSDNDNSGGGVLLRYATTESTITPSFWNCLFTNNKATWGGAMYNENNAGPTLTLCVFQNNSAISGGGAMLNWNKLGTRCNPKIYNCLFLNNQSSFGGAIRNVNSVDAGECHPEAYNCTFRGNVATGDNGGGALYNIRDKGTIDVDLQNCIIYGNGGAASINNREADANVRIHVNANYSLFETSVKNWVVTIGNRTTADSPFISATDPQIAPCASSTIAIDRGTNYYNYSGRNFYNFSVDLAGNARLTGYTMDIGAFEYQPITAGAIGGLPIIPYPYEDTYQLTSLTAATGSPGPTVISWQQRKEGETEWSSLPDVNVQSIKLPSITNEGRSDKSFYFRRVITTRSCTTSAVTAMTNPITVKVVPASGQITGYVYSKDGNIGIANATVIAVRTTTGLAGSPRSMTYTTITESGGQYLFEHLYSGVDPSITPTGSVSASSFLVKPSYADPDSPTLVHSFAPSSQTVTLGYASSRTLQPFLDQTAYGISGKTLQRCDSCILANTTSTTGTVSCGVDSVTVKIYKTDGVLIGQTTSASLVAPGMYSLNVSNPTTYTFTAEAKGLQFAPIVKNITSSVYNLNFESSTLRTVTGYVWAGCKELIGQTELEFTDVLKDAKGNILESCFKKRVTTDLNGKYEIKLPPRVYKVQVISFFPNTTAGIQETDLKGFINNTLPIDSLIRDLTSTTATVALNLTYERKPTLLIEGLASPAACGINPRFSVMAQNDSTKLTIRMFQGDALKGCPVSGGLITTTAVSGTAASTSATTSTYQSGTLLVTTSVQRGITETLSLTFVNGVAKLVLIPGEPNTIGDKQWSFAVQFFDKFNRDAAIFSRPIVVTGVKAGTKTFETVTPAIPLFVLHDPPGDGSFSERSALKATSNSWQVSYSGDGSVGTYGEAKVGIKALTGLGFATTTAFQVVAGGSINIGARVNQNNEYELQTVNTSSVKTSNLPTSVGAGADVVVGAAFNMIYTVATEISVTSSCTIAEKSVLAVFPYQVKTTYNYPVDFIRRVVIPNLQNLVRLAKASPQASSADSLKSIQGYENDVKSWSQILKDNETNKAQAKADTNISFAGGGLEISASQTSDTTATSSQEWAIYIDREAAIGLHIETSGNEGDLGVKTYLKLERGSAKQNTTTRSITTGYTLTDNDPFDRFSVDIGRDPKYGTPVFRLLAGESSCPPEADTRNRDQIQFTAKITTLTKQSITNGAVFRLTLGNASEVITDTTRTFQLKLLAESNPYNATVKINGTAYSTPVPYNIDRGQTLDILVSVEPGVPGDNPIYSYQNLVFELSACGGSAKTIALSVTFENPCSSITLASPGPNWVSTTADQNRLPVVLSGYTIANLKDVSLEYDSVGRNNWRTVFVKTPSQLTDSGTQSEWNTTNVKDGFYKMRLRLNCPSGIVFSNEVTGQIDRTPPVPFGLPQPTNRTYVLGSTIGTDYDEPLACSRIKSSSSRVMTRLTNGQPIPIPVTVGCYNNQITIVPLSSLTPYTGEVLSVTLTGIADIYGNIRSTPDVWTFQVGSSTAATGTGSLSVVAATSGGQGTGNAPSAAGAVGASMYENAAGTMNMTFQLPQAAPNNIYINFTVGGTASFGTDYTTTYVASSTTAQPLSATMNGAIGTIMIPKGTTSVTMKIDPVGDPYYEPDETVIISLLSGGDYGISAASSVTAVILNDDPLTNIITSIRTGNWEDPDTWDLGRIPLTSDQVILNQNHTVTLTTEGSAKRLTHKPNARLRMPFSTTRLRIGF